MSYCVLQPISIYLYTYIQTYRLYLTGDRSPNTTQNVLLLKYNNDDDDYSGTLVNSPRTQENKPISRQFCWHIRPTAGQFSLRKRVCAAVTTLHT